MNYREDVKKYDILSVPGSCIVTYKDGSQVCYSVTSGYKCREMKENPNVSKVVFWPYTFCDYFHNEFHSPFSTTPRMLISFTPECEPNTSVCEYCIEFPDPDDRTEYICNDCCIAYFQPGFGFFKPKFL